MKAVKLSLSLPPSLYLSHSLFNPSSQTQTVAYTFLHWLYLPTYAHEYNVHTHIPTYTPYKFT